MSLKRRQPKCKFKVGDICILINNTIKCKILKVDNEYTYMLFPSKHITTCQISTFEEIYRILTKKDKLESL